jgi:hypothetical protein
VSVFQEGNSFTASYTLLSLDRSLNFVNFTKRFDFFRDDSLGNRVKRSSAGLSAGIINAGVGAIDGRDSHGFKTEELSTSENQFYIAVANKFSDKLALGVAAKFYYYSLYEDLSSTSLGFDVGILYTFNPNFQIALVLADINSQYKWDTADLYGVDGTSTTDKFPLRKKIAASYYHPDSKLLVAGEFEFDNYNSKILRVGAEYNVYEKLFLRAGVDNINISNSDDPARPSLGFGYTKIFGDMALSAEYAFVLEQYSPSDRHVIGLNFIF